MSFTGFNNDHNQDNEDSYYNKVLRILFQLKIRFMLLTGFNNNPNEYQLIDHHIQLNQLSIEDSSNDDNDHLTQNNQNKYQLMDHNIQLNELSIEDSSNDDNNHLIQDNEYPLIYSRSSEVMSQTVHNITEEYSLNNSYNTDSTMERRSSQNCCRDFCNYIKTNLNNLKS